jgi:hypothetical protein
MTIAYQPATELAEVRKVDGWHVLPALPAKVLRAAPCDDEVSAWFSTEWTDNAVLVLSAAPPAVMARPFSLEERFREHAARWERETGYLSSTPKKVLHESYQAIIAMGPDVVPILLRDLQRTQRSWFWALRHLTEADPVPPEDRGRLDKMITAWTAWGKKEGKI